MAAVSLFWDTNMAAMLSCENTIPFIISDRISHLIGVNFHEIMPST